MSATPKNGNEADLEQIKEWLKKQPHLPDSWDETGLKSFLIRCNYSLEKCKRKLDAFFTMKNALPDFFNNRDVAVSKKSLSKFLYMILVPKLLPGNYRLCITAPIGTEFENLSTLETLKMVFLMSDIRMVSGDNGSEGEVLIIDSNVSFCAYMIRHTSPGTIKKFMVCSHDAYPAKVKAIHLINVSSMLYTALNIVKPFLKEKLRNRIQLHHSLDSLYEQVPKELLPEEYGGTGGTLAELSEETWKLLEKYQEWLKEDEGVKADESKRPGKAVDPEELFGLEGSFRQLSID